MNARKKYAAPLLIIGLILFGLFTFFVPASTPSIAQVNEWFTYEDTDPMLQYTGTWSTVDVAPAAYDGKLTYSNQSGDSLLIPMNNATGIQVLYSSGQEGGTFTAQLFDENFDELETLPASNYNANGYGYGHILVLDELPQANYYLQLTIDTGYLWIEAVKIQQTVATVMELAPYFSDNFDEGYPSSGWLAEDRLSLLLRSHDSGYALRLPGDYPDGVSTRILADASGGVKMQFRLESGQLQFRLLETSNGSYRLVLDNLGLVTVYRNDVVFATGNTGAGTAEAWRTIRLTTTNGNIVVIVDDVEVIHQLDPQPLTEGTFSFVLDGQANSTFWLDDFALLHLTEVNPETSSFGATGVPEAASQAQSASAPPNRPTAGQLVFQAYNPSNHSTSGLKFINFEENLEVPPGSLPHVPLTEPLYHRDFDPAISPNGAQVAFARRLTDTGFDALFVVDAGGTGTNLRQLTEHIGVSDPTWSPDGRYIAFGQGGNIRKIDTLECDEPEEPLCTPTLLVTSPGGGEPAWSADNRIAFTSSANIYVCTVNEITGQCGAATQMTSTTAESHEDNPEYPEISVYYWFQWSVHTSPAWTKPHDQQPIQLVYVETLLRYCGGSCSYPNYNILWMHTSPRERIYGVNPPDQATNLHSPSWSPINDRFAVGEKSPQSKRILTVPYHPTSGQMSGSIRYDAGVVNLNYGVYDPDWGVVRSSKIVVDTVAYEGSLITNGNCSLGEAINAANNNQPVDDCGTGSAELTDQIILAPQDGEIFEETAASASSQGFSVLSRQPGVYSPMNQGAGDCSASIYCITADNEVVIKPCDNADGCDATTGTQYTLRRDLTEVTDRLFYVEDGASLTLDGLILHGGNFEGDGGALYVENGGALTLQNKTIIEYVHATGKGGAIYNAGTLKMTDSVIRYNTALIAGGGIYDDASSLSDLAENIVSTSCIFNNAAPDGGGAYLEGGLAFNTVWWGGLNPSVFPDVNTVQGVNDDHAGTPSGAIPEGILTSQDCEPYGTTTKVCITNPLLAGDTVTGFPGVVSASSLPSGLLIYYTPSLSLPINTAHGESYVGIATVEAPPNPYADFTPVDPSVTEPFTSNVPWGSRNLVVTARVEVGTPGVTLMQIWYQLSWMENSAIRYPIGWIPARIDENIGRHGYIEGLGTTHNSDPCKGYVDDTSDYDGDDVPVGTDNCPSVANEHQNDWNQDGLGDVCADYDRDGSPDEEEFDKGTDPTNPDSDNDGEPDGEDPTGYTLICILEVVAPTVNMRTTRNRIGEFGDPTSNVAAQAVSGDQLRVYNYTPAPGENEFAWWGVKKLENPEELENPDGPILFVIDNPLSVKIKLGTEGDCDQIKLFPTPTPTPEPEPDPNADTRVYELTCTDTAPPHDPVAGINDAQKMPVYIFSGADQKWTVAFIRRGWFLDEATSEYKMVKLSVAWDPADENFDPTIPIDHEDFPDVVVWLVNNVEGGGADNYTWYRVTVPINQVTNGNDDPYNTSGPKTAYIQVSRNVDQLASFLVPEGTSDCPLPEPPPPPLNDSEGPEICGLLQTELTNVGTLPLGVTLQYYGGDGGYPVLNRSSQFSSNVNYGPILTFNKSEGDTRALLTDLVKVYPCVYFDSGNPVVRFGTNALKLTQSDFQDYEDPAASYQSFLRAAQYSLILNYANYYASGPIGGIRDWCFPGDTLYMDTQFAAAQGDPEALERPTIGFRHDLEFDDGTEYNVPVPGARCYQRLNEPSRLGEGNGPCGTLPTAVFRAMGIFNISDFNDLTYTADDTEGTWWLGRYYWAPDGYDKMFDPATREFDPITHITYVDGYYDPITISFIGTNRPSAAPEPVFSTDGFDPQDGEANWSHYEVNRESPTWWHIKPGDIVNIYTRNRYGKTDTDYPDAEPLHVQIIVGWGPDRPGSTDYVISKWEKNYQGELYATYWDIPVELRNDYVPYVIDRGLRRYGNQAEDYAMRGPRPFHSQYSVSNMTIWVVRGNPVTRQ